MQKDFLDQMHIKKLSVSLKLNNRKFVSNSNFKFVHVFVFHVIRPQNNFMGNPSLSRLCEVLYFVVYVFTFRVRRPRKKKQERP